MPRDLPIAIVAICNDSHAAMYDALLRTLSQITPEQLLIFTDDPGRIPLSLADYHDFHGDYMGAMRCLWYVTPLHIQTSHFLWMQPDSWVLDATKWTAEFLDFDYVGAPWPLYGLNNDWVRLGYKPGENVGNGGFSLRSLRLAAYLAKRPQECPLWPPEDDSICRRYRPQLEEAGFRWAPTELAERFSFECGVPPLSGTFGFHGAWHARRLRDA